MDSALNLQWDSGGLEIASEVYLHEHISVFWGEAPKVFIRFSKVSVTPDKFKSVVSIPSLNSWVHLCTSKEVSGSFAPHLSLSVGGVMGGWKKGYDRGELAMDRKAMGRWLCSSQSRKNHPISEAPAIPIQPAPPWHFSTQHFSFSICDVYILGRNILRGPFHQDL